MDSRILRVLFDGNHITLCNDRTTDHTVGHLTVVAMQLSFPEFSDWRAMRNRCWLVPLVVLSVLLTMTSQALLAPLVATAIGRGGVVSTLAYGIDGPGDVTTGPDGALWFTNLYNDTIGRITTAGVVTNYTGTGIDAPQSIAAGSDGALWFTNW